MGRETEMLQEGKTYLGIEFGSTRIKAVLLGEDKQMLASGSHDWENRLEDGVWTYRIPDIWEGLQDCYGKLAAEVSVQYGVELTQIGAIGFSAMMHGYMAFDEAGELLVPFRTWRNTMTAQAAKELTALFAYPIPQRWSIAHLYQAILNGEPHTKQICFLTTLAGYVHRKLTGENILGIGEASGMFPIDSKTGNYNREMLLKFDNLVEERYPGALSKPLLELLPKVEAAGTPAGYLTKEGAALLDKGGKLQAGIPLCPPEGDAGTGMVATNSVAKRTGNVSAGTSIFSMVVLEKPLKGVYEEIDLVTTPMGEPVAMVHCNNCTSDLNAWVNLFAETLAAFGQKPDTETLYGTLYRKALEGNKDCSGLLAYNYFSGEPVTGLLQGRPLFVRKPDADLTLANFMRTHLYASLATLKAGMDILQKEEVRIDRLLGHGGLYKTPGVAQRLTAAALKAPITVMETAGEGGAWGMAILAAFLLERQENESLADYLDNHIFAGSRGVTVEPDKEEMAGFDAFLQTYLAGLPIEKAAVECL